MSTSHEVDWLQKSAKSMAVVAVMNVLLALVALVREILTASVLGTGRAADEFFLAYFYPDTIWNLLIGSSLAQAALPVLSRLRARGEDSKHLVSYFTTMSLVLGSAFVLVTVCITKIFSFSDTFGLLLRITSLAAPFYPPALMFVAYLQVEGRFGFASAAQILFNLVYTGALLVSSLAGLSETTAAFAQSSAVPISALTMFVATMVLGRGINLRFSPDATAKMVLQALSAPLLLALGTLILPVVERFVASSLGPGNVASLNYAYKISQFPVWVLSAAVGAVTFPAIADSLARESGHMRSIIRSSVGTMLLVSCPTAFALYSLRQPVVLALFSLRSPNPPSAIAATLGSFCASIVPQSILIIVVRYHLAKQSTRLLVFSAILSSAAGAIFNILGVTKLGLPVVGVGLTLQCVVSLLILAPEVWKSGELETAGLWKAVLCAMPMLLSGHVFALLSRFTAGGGSVGLIFRLGASSAACACVSLACGLWLGIPEISLLWQKTRTRLMGVPS